MTKNHYRFSFLASHRLRIFGIFHLLLAACVGIQCAVPTSVMAAAPTPTPIPLTTITPPAAEELLTASQSPEVNENLKKVIDKVVEENKEAVDAKLLAAKGARRGMVGEVKSVREGTLTIKTHRSTQVIPIDKSVQLLKANTMIESSGIAVGDWATVIGSMVNDDFQAQKVIVSSKPLHTAKPIVLLGSIESLTKSQLTFKDRSSGDTKTWNVVKSTLWQNSDGAKAVSSDFTESLQVLAVGVDTESSTTATIIRALAAFSKPDTKKQ